MRLTSHVVTAIVVCAAFLERLKLILVQLMQRFLETYPQPQPKAEEQVDK